MTYIWTSLPLPYILQSVSMHAGSANLYENFEDYVDFSNSNLDLTRPTGSSHLERSKKTVPVINRTLIDISTLFNLSL